MIVRDYNCQSCPNRNVCEKNNACRNQCKDSIKRAIKNIKVIKRNGIRAHNKRIKWLKHKLRQL